MELSAEELATHLHTAYAEVPDISNSKDNNSVAPLWPESTPT